MTKLNTREIYDIDAAMIYGFFSYLFEHEMRDDANNEIGVDDGCLTYDLTYEIIKVHENVDGIVFTAVVEDTVFDIEDRSLGYKGGTLVVSKVSGIYSGYVSGMSLLDQHRILCKLTNRYELEAQDHFYREIH